VNAVNAVNADLDMLREIEIKCSIPFFLSWLLQGTENIVDTLLVVWLLRHALDVGISKAMLCKTLFDHAMGVV
jgi:hypothetical protein